jgi:hypothetical protein
VTRRLEAVAGWVALGLAELVLIVAWWPSRRNQFGIIDDHGIVQLLAGRTRLPLGDLVPTIADTAVEPIGRFRPLFWVGQVLEAAVAGNHASWWYVDRLLLASITLAAVAVGLRALVHPVTAALLAGTVVLGVQFETWVRLGAAEAYAMPLLAVGLAWVVVAGPRAGLLRLSPGLALVVLSAFAKENFLLVSVPVLALVPLLAGWRRLRRVDWAAWAVLVLVSLGDALMIVVQLHRHRAQYAQVRDLAALQAWGSFAARAAISGQGLLFAAVLALLVAAAGAWRNRTFVLTAVAAVLLFSTQVVFYAGGAMAGRYLYPVVLATVVVWVLSLAPAAHGPLTWLRPRITNLLALAAAVLLAVDMVGSLTAQRPLVVAGAERTRAFRAALDQVEDVLRRRDLHTVVVQPWDPLSDQERAVSLARYLHAETGAQVMVLPAEHPSSAFSRSLAQDIRLWSRDGAPAYDLVPYDQPTRCLSIVFNPAQKSVCPRTRPSPG